MKTTKNRIKRCWIINHDEPLNSLKQNNIKTIGGTRIFRNSTHLIIYKKCIATYWKKQIELGCRIYLNG
jgi:hypothetical protein